MIRRRVVLAVAAMSLFAIATSGGLAVAYTVIGATFVPDHGSTGAKVVVYELPLAVDCPTVDVWLAPGDASPTITSAGDARLIALAGDVRSEPIGVGANDTRPATTFAFRVPAIPAGTYATYWQCRGGAAGDGEFGPGPMPFVVDHPLPGTSSPEAAPPPVSAALTVPIASGVLAGLAWLLRPRDRRRAS